MFVAGLTAMAQVYSVNVVGYVNLTLQPGFTMIANPLDAGAGNNTVGKLLTTVPEGTILYKWTGTTYAINSFSFGAWDVPDQSLAPGEGAFIRIPGTTAATVTFVGEVMQGTPITPAVAIPQGFSMLGCQVPMEASLQVQEFPAVEGDIVYKWNPSAKTYSIHSFSLGEWDVAPVIAVGEGFWARKMAAVSWPRSFTVAP